MGFSRQEYWSGVPLPSPRSRLDIGKTSHSNQSGFHCVQTENSGLGQPRLEIGRGEGGRGERKVEREQDR